MCGRRPMAAQPDDEPAMRGIDTVATRSGPIGAGACRRRAVGGAAR